jgi:hypothetical protein
MNFAVQAAIAIIALLPFAGFAQTTPDRPAKSINQLP